MKNKINNKKFCELYQEWECKRNFLIEQGYTVIYIWQCEWDQMLKNDPVLKEFVENMQIPDRMRPRGAFRGMY